MINFTVQDDKSVSLGKIGITLNVQSRPTVRSVVEKLTFFNNQIVVDSTDTVLNIYCPSSIAYVSGNCINIINF